MWLTVVFCLLRVAFSRTCLSKVYTEWEPEPTHAEPSDMCSQDFLGHLCSVATTGKKSWTLDTLILFIAGEDWRSIFMSAHQLKCGIIPLIGNI